MEASKPQQIELMPADPLRGFNRSFDLVRKVPAPKVEDFRDLGGSEKEAGGRQIADRGSLDFRLESKPINDQIETLVDLLFGPHAHLVGAHPGQSSNNLRETLVVHHGRVRRNWTKPRALTGTSARPPSRRSHRADSFTASPARGQIG